MPERVCNDEAYPARTDDDLCNIQLHELIGSREFHKSPKGDMWTLYWTVIGTDDECKVRRRVENDTIGIYTNFRMERLREYSLQRIGQWVWTVTSYYGYGAYPASFHTSKFRPTNMTMSTVGGKHDLKKAVSTISTSDNAPDVKDAIEWDGKEVQGTSVPTARTRWRETWKMSIGSVFESNGFVATENGLMTSEMESVRSYYDELYGMTAKSLWERWTLMTGWVHGFDNDLSTYLEVDIGPYRAFMPGSILFIGATMTQLNDYEFEVAMEFEYVPNTWEHIPRTIEFEAADPTTWPDDDRAERAGDLRAHPNPFGFRPTTGDDLQIFKHGWDYLQFFYETRDEDADDDEGKVTLPVPAHFVYQQVIRRAPFDYLGITTRPPAKDRWETTKWPCHRMVGKPMPGAITKADGTLVRGEQGQYVGEKIEPMQERAGLRWEQNPC